jgi:hypothetical protein
LDRLALLVLPVLRALRARLALPGRRVLRLRWLVQLVLPAPKVLPARALPLKALFRLSVPYLRLVTPLATRTSCLLRATCTSGMALSGIMQARLSAQLVRLVLRVLPAQQVPLEIQVLLVLQAQLVLLATLVQSARPAHKVSKAFKGMLAQLAQLALLAQQGPLAPRALKVYKVFKVSRVSQALPAHKVLQARLDQLVYRAFPVMLAPQVLPVLRVIQVLLVRPAPQARLARIQR